MLKIGTSPSKLSFEVHKEVEKVISHFSWLDECAVFIENASLELATEKNSKGYVRLLLEHEVLDDSGKSRKDEDDDIGSRSDSFIGSIALNLNRATLNAYVSQFEVAHALLNEVQGHLDFVSDLKHKEILKYLADALEWAIGTLEVTEAGKQIVEDEMATSLCNRWANFKVDTDLRSKAVVIFLKGCLASALKVTNKKTLEYFVQAMNLDPMCTIWYHYAYRKMRRIRKDRNERVPSAPTGEERRICEKAYKMRPKNDFISVLDYAILLKESIWGCGRVEWENKEKEYMHCQRILEDVLLLATQVNHGFTIKAKIQLAEFLLFGKGSKLDQHKGRRLLLECEKESPHDTCILHKIGKFYHRGAYGTWKWKNPKLAEKFYERAISDISTNFPCLMDYFRLLEENREHGKMLAVLDKALEFGRRDSYVARLHAIKGSVLWTSSWEEQDKRKACESWIHVLENFPDSANEVYKIVEDRPNVMLILEGMKSQSINRCKLRLIADFIKELKERKMSDESKANVPADVTRGPRSGGRKLFDPDEGKGTVSSTYHMKMGKGKKGMIHS